MKTKAFLLLSLLSACAVGARAETETVDGVTWTYRVENGFVLLGGGDTTSTAVPKSTSGTVVAPATLGGKPVKTVSSFAFNRCDGISAVTLPDGLAIVDTNAFASCYGVQTVSFPDSLRQIGDHAFYNCIHLKSISIPGSVKRIEDACFSGCGELETVSISSGVAVLCGWAFRNCTSLTTLEIPDSVTNIAWNAFLGCYNLRSLSLPSRFNGKTDSWELPETCEITFRKRLTRGESNEAAIDLRPDPRKIEPGASERLAFSAKWADPSQTASSVEIALDGAPYLTLPGGEGTFGWTPDRGGLFTFTHTAHGADGTSYGEVYEAQFLVDNYSFGEGDIVATNYEGVYDGNLHGISVVCSIPAASVKYAQSKDGPFTVSPPLYKNFRTGTKTWYVVEAPFYQTVTNYATVTISKRPLSIVAEPKSKAYGATDPALTYTLDGLVQGDEISGTLERESGESVGTYAIARGTLSVDEVNYALSFTGATFTITKGTIPDTDKIHWNASGDGATFLYDGAEHGVALTGLPAGMTATYAGNVATNAGNYTATAHLVYDTANYETVADPAPLAWSISKRPITLMAASKEKPYDGWPLEVKPEDITVAGSGYAPGECFAYGDYASITDVGEIPATFSYADSATAKVANYDVTVQGGQTLKITVGGDQISVTADSGVWAYDGETHRKESWTFVNGDKLLDGHVFDIAISTNSAVTTPAEGIVSNAFDHVKIVEESSGRDMTRNYNLFVYEGTLQVTNAPIGPNMALDRTVETVYDGQEHSAAAEAPALLTPATVRYRVGDGDWTAGAPSWTHAGTYTAEFEVSAQFYDPATGTVRVAISPRPVTLSSPTKSKPYDGTALTFAANEIEVGGDGIVAGENFSYSDFASITDAGRTDASFAWAAGAGTLAADYDVTVRKGTLTVTKNAEEISVTAKSATWVYDGETHALREWTAENLGALVAGDALDVIFDPASAITEPGETTNRIVSVKVMRGGTDVTANYTVSWWPGTLTMTKAEIGPKMPGISTSATAVYDGAGHAATVAAPTLLTAPVAVSYAATADGPWGAAPVAFTNAGSWTAFFRMEAPHYEPYVGTSTMIIMSREVTLVSAGATKVYDGTPLRKDEVSVKEGSLPFAPGEGFTATCSGTITDVGGVENVFEYALKANTKADNYTIRKEYGWLRVTPATLDVDNIGARASWRGLYDGVPHGIEVISPIPRSVVTYALESGNEEAYGTANPMWTNVSTHVVYFKILAPNYEPGYGSATVEISKRPVTLMAASKEKPYDGWPLEVNAEDITVAGSGYAPGECFAYGDYASITDVGEIPATFSYADSATAKVANYDVTVQGWQTLKVTVGGDQISVTADSGVWAYDGETHRKESWTFVNGDKLLDGHVFDIAISADSAVTTPAEGIVSNAFDHVRIVESASGHDMTRNYNLFVYEGTLQVTNAPIGPNMALHRTVEAVYDGQEHSAAAEAPALLQPATVRYRVGDGDWTAAAPSWTHAGTYTAEFEISAQFYDPATGTVQVAISPRPVTLSSPTKSKPYDGTALTFAADEIAAAPGGSLGELAPPFPAGESFVYSGFASITDAGRTDAAFAWAAGAGTLAADYAVTIRKGTLSVTKNAEEISVTAKSATWVYDGKTHSLHEWTAENINALAAGDVLDVAFDPASAIAVPGNVENSITGVRVLRGGTDVTANYTVSWWPGTLTMAKADIGPKMEGISTAATAVYDGTGHAATVAAPALLTTPVTVRYAATASGPWSATPVAFTDAGSWTAFFRVEAPNYEPFIGTTTTTISPREVTLVSDGATKVYDGSPLRKNSVSVKAGSLSFAAGEGFTATCSGTITDVGGVENVFDYTLKANTKADNYTIRKEYGWLRVTPATLDIDGIGARASWRGPYDGVRHGINVVPGVPRAVVTYALESGNEEAYGAENPTWKDVSSNTVFFKILAPNHEPGYGSATVVVTKRPLAIKADPKSKVFGAKDPALTYAVSNLVSGDVVSGKLVRDSGEAVGTYAIRQGTLSAGGNYAISFTGATFTIEAGGIVVDASAGAMGYAGEYDGAAHGAALRVKNPATGATVQWSATAGGPWQAASPTFVDAGTNTVWWRVTAPNFDPLAGTAQVVIAPRPISKASVGVLTNEYYTGYPVEPVPTVTDTVPITTNDWSVAWEDNVEIGHARAFVTGRRNYCGEVLREFEIVLKPVIVIVIDLSNVEVGQGKWGTATLTTNGVPVDVAAGSRVELELPQGTPVALSFTPNAGFKIGSVIVDRRTWTTQSEWAFEAKADRAFQASYIPNPRTTVRWKLAAATGHYHAQLALPVYPGYTEALANLKFHFADRVQNGKTYAQLWDYTVPTTAGRHVAAEETLDGKKYRFVPLDASKMAGLAAGKRVVYGVTDATLAQTTDSVPQAQRLIGLYILKRISPVSGQETDAGVENFIGAFSWETNGKTYYQPVGAGYANGVIAEKILDAEDLDAAEALGFDPAFLAVAEPACRFTAFSPEDGIDGWFEVYAEAPDGIEAVSTGTTENAIFRLWGKSALADEWTELPRATFPEKDGGSVRFSETETDLGDSQFFGISIEVKPTHE